MREMGKLQYLQIVLSRPQEDAVYEPGDHVDGYIIIEVKDTMKVKGRHASLYACVSRCNS